MWYLHYWVTMGSAARRTVSGVPPDHDVLACPYACHLWASCNTNTSSSALFLGYSILLITALLLSSPRRSPTASFHRHPVLLLKTTRCFPRSSSAWLPSRQSWLRQLCQTLISPRIPCRRLKTSSSSSKTLTHRVSDPTPLPCHGLR